MVCHCQCKWVTDKMCKMVKCLGFLQLTWPWYLSCSFYVRCRKERSYSGHDDQAATFTRPVERGGEGGEVFPGPATFGGPRRRSKMLKIVFQMASFGPKIYIKSIFDPAGGAYDAPPNPSSDGEGTPLPTFPPSISRHTEWWWWWGGLIGPRDNVFPGPAVALDGPDLHGWCIVNLWDVRF